MYIQQFKKNCDGKTIQIMINYQYNRLDYIFTLSLNVSEYVSEYEKTVFCVTFVRVYSGFGLFCCCSSNQFA